MSNIHVAVKAADLAELVEMSTALVQQHIRECQEAVAVCRKKQEMGLKQYGAGQEWRVCCDPDVRDLAAKLAEFPAAASLRKVAAGHGG